MEEEIEAGPQDDILPNMNVVHLVSAVANLRGSDFMIIPAESGLGLIFNGSL